MQVYRPPIDIEQHIEPLLAILRSVVADPALDREALHRLLRRYLKSTGGERAFFSNDDLLLAYRTLAGTHGLPPLDSAVLERLRLKPVRTASGVTTVTVLTKPFPCPGECIFCPNDVRMPKSYLYDEPGAQRAGQNAFDPYLQTWSRLAALRKIGHPTDKIEIIILGGTWSFYPETYQIWFVKRIFDALHDFGANADRTDEVRAALQTGSQFQPGEVKPAPALLVHGEDKTLSYNQAVQQLYRAEMERSRGQADAIAWGLMPRTAIAEFATWDELEAAHRLNEDAPCRCVGLVVETRPDHLDEAETMRIRRLGCTKVQIGIQSLDDEVLRLNRRGHTVEQTRRAIRLLRRAGFKIHAHWMPNLFGSTPDRDIEDYTRLFAEPDFRPDELKIYPCSLIESAELMQRYRDGTWRPYTHDELVRVLAACFRHTPEYCRLTRVIRDIPGTDIVTGNRMTNLRQIVEDSLAEQGERSSDIRAREIRGQAVAIDDLRLDEQRYSAAVGEEIFLQYITEDRRIAGFLRLLLPGPDAAALASELHGAAIIREVHVYGQALRLGEAASGRAQHAGLGTRLIEHAAELARTAGYARLAVISAVGTRGYYRARGFEDGLLYQVRALASETASETGSAV